MYKNNEVRAAVTRCDECSKPACFISPSGTALCATCATRPKQASEETPALKSCAESLVPLFK